MASYESAGVACCRSGILKLFLKLVHDLALSVTVCPSTQANQRTIADSLLQDQIDALRRENNSLKDTLAQLHSKQVGHVSNGTRNDAVCSKQVKTA